MEDCHYQYNVVAYGLVNALSFLQSFMMNILRDMLNHFVIVYIDDILAYSRNYSEHIKHVRLVLHRLLKHGLYIKAEKCEFHQTELSFLGYCINPVSICNHSLSEWPEPDTIKALQGFSFVAVLLTDLLKGKRPKHLSFSPAAKKAFEELKQRLVSMPFEPSY